MTDVVWDRDEVKELLKWYDEELDRRRKTVLAHVSAEMGRDQSVHQFHGIIGGKYRRFADVARAQFSDPNAMVRRWLDGLAQEVERELDEERETYGRAYGERAANRLARLLQHEVIWEYTRLFHERSFFRHLDERVRAKPSDNLWSIWFGLNQMPWGLMIAPDRRGEEWRNDVSEIRRVPYAYWTVEHAISEGFINPDEDRPHAITGVDALEDFYANIMKRMSRSQYEKGLIDRYTSFVHTKSRPEEVPLLIPEMRYAGIKEEHKYRLDFVVLNPYVMEMTGYELSPQSSHLRVTGMNRKKQKEVNAELKEKWDREMRKRREYYETYGIRIETFTDEQLSDVDGCFECVKEALEASPTKTPSISASFGRLKALLDTQ